MFMSDSITKNFPPGNYCNMMISRPLAYSKPILDAGKWISAWQQVFAGKRVLYYTGPYRLDRFASPINGILLWLQQ